MSLAQKIAKSVTKIVQNNLGSVITEDLSDALTEKFNLDRQEVQEFLTCYFEKQMTKSSKKGKKTAYSVFQSENRKDYAKTLEQQGSITSDMNSKEKMSVISKYTSERWNSIKLRHQDKFDEYKQKAIMYKEPVEKKEKTTKKGKEPVEKKEKTTKKGKEKERRQKVYTYLKTNYVDTGVWSNDDLEENFETILASYTEDITWDDFIKQVETTYFDVEEEMEVEAMNEDDNIDEYEDDDIDEDDGF